MPYIVFILFSHSTHVPSPTPSTTHNSFLKGISHMTIKKLKTKKGRDESGLFIVEGEKFVSEIPEPWIIRQYAMSQRFVDTHDISMYKKRARCEIVRDSIFDGISDTVSPQGILAVCEKKHWELSNELFKSGSFFLMGENLNDPGNIGTLIRTATAANAEGVILTSGEIYNPKVIRASAGAVFRLPIITNIILKEAVTILKSQNVQIYATHPRGAVFPYSLDLTKRFCLLIGNESHGISDEAISFADARVSLPMSECVESLNASTAGSILLYEAVRQRLGGN